MFKFYRFITVFYFLLFFASPQILFAGFEQDDNNGYFSVDFGNSEGLETITAPFGDNVTVDSGTASLTNPAQNGTFSTSPITPASFASWGEIDISASFNKSSDLLVRPIKCDDNVVNTINNPPAFQNFQPLTSGKLDLSSIDASNIDCIRVQVQLSDDDSILPTVSNLRVTWTPLPVLLTRLTGDETKAVGEKLSYTVDYSVSFVNDKNIVVYVPLPSHLEGTVKDNNPAYGGTQVTSGQADPVFVSATGGGQYTASQTTVDGIVVPANSVYWELGDVDSGVAGTLRFELKSSNGLENGITYDLQSEIDSVAAEKATSDLITSTLTSSPNPELEKKVSGTVFLNNENVVTEAGSFDSIITYILKYKNKHASTGRENIFQPILNDDLSFVFDKLINECGTVDPETLINVDGTTLSALPEPGGGDSITFESATKILSWNSLNDLGPGASSQVQFNVDYGDCFDAVGNLIATPDTYIKNTVVLSSPNTSELNDSVDVVLTQISLTPTGSFAKGDKVDGVTEIRALRNDNDQIVQTYEDIATYFLFGRNSGAVMMKDMVFFDRIPDGLEFNAATLSDIYNGTIFYSTSLDLTPPVHDYSQVEVSGDLDAVGNNLWEDLALNPPANKGDVTWVAFYIPCLASSYFPSTNAASVCFEMPSSVIAEVQARILTPVNTCQSEDIENQGHFYVYEIGDDIENNTASPLPSPLTALDTGELTHVSPALGVLGSSSSPTIDGPADIDVGETATYTISIENTGLDTVENLEVRIPAPSITVNGTSKILDFVGSPTGGTADLSNLPNEVTVNLGTLPPGSNLAKTVEVSFRIPSGVIDQSSFTVNAYVSAEDPENCVSNITASVDTSTLIRSVPFLQLRKERNETLIPSKDPIHYQLNYSNIGEAPTQKTWVVDRVPLKTRFVEAYTNSTDDIGNVYTCGAGCEVFFSKASPDLPADLTPIDPLTGSVIESQFVPGIEVVLGTTTPNPGSGVWIPDPNYAAVSEVIYVAFKVDDVNITPPQLVVGAERSVGFQVINDDDGEGPGTAGSNEGTLIRNSAAVLSEELLQAIGNQVITTILEDPGLRMTKESDVEVVGASQSFNWLIDYYNDSATADKVVTLTDVLPYGVDIVGIYHRWNATAQTNDPGLPINEIEISSDTNLTLTANGDGTKTIELRVSDNGAGLRSGDLAFLEGGTLRIEVRAIDSLSSGAQLENTVEGCYENIQSFCTYDSDIVTIRNPDLTISKFSDNPNPLNGETINYTLQVSNIGDLAATDVTIKDTLDNGLTYIGPTTVITTGWDLLDNGDGSPTITSGPNSEEVLNWTQIDGPSSAVGTIPAGESVFITYAVKVTGDTGDNFDNNVTVDTPLEEDDETNNDSDEEVEIPFPDVYVSKSSPLTAEPGDTFAYTVQFGNFSKQSADGVYLIDTLPDNLKLVAVSGGAGAGLYCNTVNNPFDVDIPLANGWSATCDNNAKFIAILPNEDDVAGVLDGNEGPHTVTISVQVNLGLAPGTPLTNNITAFVEKTNCDDSSDGDEADNNDSNCSNNTSSATTTTPGFDLYINKKGSIEGVFPGTTPGTALTYTIEFGNQGSQPICDVYIKDELPEDAGVQLVVKSDPFHSFTNLNLTDAAGNEIFPVDSLNNEISDPITIGFNDSTNTWTIGDTNSSNVCIPAGAKTSFQTYVTIDSSLDDNTLLENVVSIDINDPSGRDCNTNDPLGPREDVCSNNTDNSRVKVYKADVTTSKTGYSCGSDDTCMTSAEIDYNFVNKDEIINWDVNYNNIGNISAENVIITERIPDGTCYTVGSVEAPGNQPEGTTLEYSNNNGSSWSYTPTADVNGDDCSVTNFRLVFNSAVPAPATFWSQSASACLDDSSLIFDGNDIGWLSTLIDDNFSAGFSVSAWIKSDDFDTNIMPIVSNFNGQWGNKNGLEFRTEPGKGLSIRFYQASPTVFIGREIANVLQNDKWHYVAATWDGTFGPAGFKLYVDGNEVNSAGYIDLSSGVVNAFQQSNQNMYLAYTVHAGPVTRYFTGSIKQVGFFKDLRSSTEILSDYQNEDLDTGDADLVVYYPLNEGTGNSANDVTANNYDGWLWQPVWSERTCEIASDNLTGGAKIIENAVTLAGARNLSLDAPSDIDNLSAANNSATILKDSNDVTHAFWIEQTTATSSDVFYWNNNNGVITKRSLSDDASSAAILDNGTSSNANYLLAKFDSDENLHVVWSERNGTKSNDAYYWNNVGGTITVINLSDSSGLFTNNNSASAILPKLALDSSNSAHIVWYEFVTGASTNAHYYTNNGDLPAFVDLSVAAVGAGLLVNNTSSFVNSVDIAVDNSGGAHVTWSERNNTSNYDAYYWYRKGATETVANLTDTTPLSGLNMHSSNTFVAVDSADKAHIVWIENNNTGAGNFGTDVFYWTDGAANATNLSNGVNFAASAFPQIKTDSADTIHISWTESNGGNNYDIYYWNSADGTKNLSNEAGHNGQNYFGYYPDMKIDSSGKAHVVWYENSSVSNPDVYYWTNSGSGGVVNVSEVTGLTEDLQATQPRIFLDASDSAHITWLEVISGFTYNNYYWSQAKGGINLTGLAGHQLSGFFGGSVTQVAFDSNNQAHIVWTSVDGDRLSDVYYYPLVNDGTATSTEITNSSGNLLSWGKLIYNTEAGEGAGITFDVLDPNNGDAIITGFAELYSADGFIDLSSLLVAAYPSIKVRANLTTTSTNLPKLYDWVVTYTTDQQPNFSFQSRVLNEGLNTALINNVVTISTDTPELDYDNNNGQYSLQVKQANLNINKTVDKSVQDPGSNVTYTVEACNAGSKTAENVIIIDTLPDDVSFVSAANCTENSGVVTCPIVGDNLSVGECQSFSITVQLSGALAGFEVLTNTACVASDTFDPDNSDNCDSASTTVSPPAGIANVYISKDGPAQANLNDTLVYTLTYGNDGNADANDVIITDTIPSDKVDFVSADNKTGADLDCSYAAPTITCVGTPVSLTLIEAAIGTIEVVVKVKNNPQLLVANEDIVNSAAIVTSSTQSNINDDSDDHTVPLVPGALSDIAGKVFVDDGDVLFDAAKDNPISGVNIILYGVDIYSNVYGPDPSSVSFTEIFGTDAAPSNFFNSLVTDMHIPAIVTPSTLGLETNYVVRAPAITDASGNYNFSALNIGTYNLLQEQPLGYASVGSNGGTVGTPEGTVEGGSDKNRITDIQLLEGEFSANNDFGEELGSIGNLVFNDNNQNGQFDSADENGIQGVEVTLYQDQDQSGDYSAGDTLVAVAITDADGLYSFDNLLLDDGDGDFDYVVVVTDSNNVLTDSTYTLGTANTDNHAQNPEGYSLSLSAGNKDIVTADFGYFGKAELGNYVWYDADEDGVQSADEPGIAGVEVKLYNSSDTLVDSTTTDGSGFYEFTNLSPGDYYVEFIAPSNDYEVTQKQIGDPAFDSDVDPSTNKTRTFNLDTGESLQTIDAGMYIPDVSPASVGNYVWYDTNKDGIQDGTESGVPGVTVELYKNGSLFSTTQTDSSGFYEFNGLANGNYQVKFLPKSDYDFSPENVVGDELDSDASSLDGFAPAFTLNAGESNDTIDAGIFLTSSNPASLGNKLWLDLDKDGIQDAGEEGVAGVIVKLYDENDNFLSQTVTTADGLYQFNNLVPGSYYVEFNPPSGFEFTLANFGGDEAKDSDANQISGVSPKVTLGDGETYADMDAGLVIPTGLPAKLGNFVWVDTNANGIQDSGETGLTDVVVNLYSSDGSFIASDVTDADGKYEFVNLAAGDYYVQVVVPENYSLSFKGQGSDTNADSDFDQDTGRSGLISLLAGDDKQDIDAGLTQNANGTIGNLVFFDQGRDGVFHASEDTAYTGIVVDLYKDSNGNGVLDNADEYLRSRTSNASGEYEFTDLPLDDGSGSFTYFVAVDSSQLNSDHEHMRGSDGVDNNSQNVNGYKITLSPGVKTNMTGDFGFAEKLPPYPACQLIDFDDDGVINSVDLDIDGDGIPNSVEGDDDIDNDGNPNSSDIDSDGDGIIDLIEAQAPYNVINPSGIDSNLDGIDNAFGNGLTPHDTDGDGLADFIDTDADNDGISDNFETQPADPSLYIPPNGADLDCDGLDDAYEDDPPSEERDDDSSGYPDFRETPLECSDVNLLPTQFTIDGTGTKLLKATEDSIKLRTKLANVGLCKGLSKSKKNEKLDKASETYSKIWQQTWSIPSQHYPCDDYLPGNCIEFDTPVAIETIRDSIKSLYKQGKRTLRPCRSRLRAKKHKKKLRKIFNSVISPLNELPTPVIQCSG